MNLRDQASSTPNEHDDPQGKIRKFFAGSEKKDMKFKHTMRIRYLPAPHTGHITMVELNRTAAKNAISKQLLAELSELVEEIHAEKTASQTRVLIITSALEDVFCAGADLKERKSMSTQEVDDFLGKLRHTFSRLADLPIPSIACISGAALGGGLELALCCHFRVISENAVIGLPETRLGIIPGAGGTYRLAEAVGMSDARSMILTGKRFVGYNQIAKKLAHEYVQRADEDRDGADPRSTLLLAQAAAFRLAENISRGGPIAIRAALEAIKGGSQEAENAAYEKVLKTKDRTEALNAFAEKRNPVFKGE